MVGKGGSWEGRTGGARRTVRGLASHVVVVVVQWRESIVGLISWGMLEAA
jgi:hypothetical protein